MPSLMRPSGKFIMRNLRARSIRPALMSTLIILSASHMRTLEPVRTDAVHAEDDDVRAGLDLGREHHGADARGHSAADIAALVERV